MSSRIAYIDGRRLRDAVVAGARHLIARKDHLDHINVFPVPDADTGTNMASSARYIVEMLRGPTEVTLRETADTIAEAALMGGRGNSGAILAQFFQGFSEGLHEGQGRTSTGQLAEAIVNGARSARLAVSEPKEGTILTVMREWSESFRDAVRSGLDMVGSLDAALETARRSLARTPDHLSVLREAHVVDAGAQGFLYLLEGVNKLIRNGWSIPEEEPDVIVDEEDIHLDAHSTEPDFRWCTECLIAGADLDRNAIRQHAEAMGDSVVLAGSLSRLRLHVHTDHPGDLLARLRHHGTISREKMDDMRLQYRHANHPPSQTVCIITDTGCDLPDDILEGLNVHQVPFRVNFGDDQYIDKVTLSPDRFYDLLRTSADHPKTAQPSPADFTRAFQVASKHYDAVLSIHVPAALSGTLQAAKLAAAQVGDGISVVDSNSGSVGMGLVVLEAAEAARRGCSEPEILSVVDSAISRLTAYYSIETTEYLVKGGRIGRTKGLVGRLLNVRIIFKAAPTGEIQVVENLFRGRDPRPIMIDLVEQGVRGQTDVRIAIAHASAPDTAAWYADRFRERLRPTTVMISELSPALGVHTGPGAVAIAALGS